VIVSLSAGIAPVACREREALPTEYIEHSTTNKEGGWRRVSVNLPLSFQFSSAVSGARVNYRGCIFKLCHTTARAGGFYIDLDYVTTPAGVRIAPLQLSW
jgi:hypothetical protein